MGTAEAPTRARSRALNGLLTVGAAAVAAVITAAPAAAEVTHYSGIEPDTTETLPCGAVWTYGYEYHGTIVSSGAGRFREVRQDYYPGTITYRGVTYTANDHQVHVRYVDKDGTPTAANNGQGLFTVMSGAGVVVFDVGHYVFNDDTEATLFQSHKILAFDEPYDFGAAICAALDQL